MNYHLFNRSLFASAHVEALTGPEVLRKEAVRVITASGPWEPMTRNGRKVSSYKTQPIVFKLEQS